MLITAAELPNTQRQRVHLYSKLTTQDRIHILFFSFTIIANSAFKAFAHINIHLLSQTQQSFQLTQAMLLLHVVSFAVGRSLLSVLSVFVTTAITFNVVTALNLILFATNMTYDTCNCAVVVCYAMISGIGSVGVLKHVWGLYPFNKAFAVAVMATLDLLGNAAFIALYDHIAVKRLYFLVTATITAIGVCFSCKLKRTAMTRHDVVDKMKRCNEIELTTALQDNNSETSSVSNVSGYNLCK